MGKITRITAIYLIITSTCSILTYGQATGDPKEDFLYGEYYLAQGAYQKALPFYKSALESQPENCNINYRIGQCYLNSIEIQVSALSFLEKAILDINEHYVAGKYKDGRAPIEAWLLLGDAYHRENRLTEASKAYHEFKSLLSTSDKDKLEVVIQKIMGLGISYEFQRKMDEIRMINLGDNLNTRFSDYNPVLSGNQMTVIYTQFWESYDRILITNLSEQGWSTPKDITTEIGSIGSCYSAALSYEGNELYLVCHDLGQYDIYISRFENGKWNKMEALSDKVNSRYRESSLSLSADGSEIYFASDRPGGEGGFDIYRATKEGDQWVNIDNLGKVINTVKDEEAPSISSDGTILYFSSDGHETIGNMDIVFSELNSKGEWGTPINVGSPVNTTNDDIYFIYFKDSKTGYISRDDPNGFGKNDMYLVQEGVFSSDENNIIIDTTNGVAIFNEEHKQRYFATSVPVSSRKAEPNKNSSSSNPASATSPVAREIPSKIGNDYSMEGNMGSSNNELSEVQSTETFNQDNNSTSSYSQADIQNENSTQNLYISDTEEYESTGYINNIDESKDYRLEEIFNQDLAEMSSSENDSIPIYTIQVYALLNPIDAKKIDFSPIIISRGNDGLHRYTYGEFIGYSKALDLLFSIRDSGYPDAFIRNVSTVQNYKLSIR